MEQLIIILKEQITLCEQLLDLSKSQSQELVNGNAIKVKKITNAISEKMKRLFLLDHRRQVVVEGIKQAHSINDPVSLVRLIESIESIDSTVKVSLLDLISALGKVADELKAYIQQNKLLLAKAMQFIDFNINVITSTTASDTYAPQGQEGCVTSKKKMFDQSI
ncbi:MAG: hypothetical protein H6Q70_1173 [Firmicutes bacterium]|nr:hypothetical protein [Bacillota bacterium]